MTVQLYMWLYMWLYNVMLQGREWWGRRTTSTPPWRPSHTLTDIHSGQTHYYSEYYQNIFIRNWIKIFFFCRSQPSRHNPNVLFRRPNDMPPGILYWVSRDSPVLYCTVLYCTVLYCSEKTPNCDCANVSLRLLGCDFTVHLYIHNKEMFRSLKFALNVCQ